MKKAAMLVLMLVVFLLLIITINLSGIPPDQSENGNSPSLSGIQIFPKDHIWNTRVDNLPADAKSDIYISDLEKDTAPHGFRHYIGNAIPYNVVNSTTPHQYITKFAHKGIYSDNVSYPIPDNPLFELGSNDHHMEIIDVDRMVLYELGGVEQLPDGSWKAGGGAVWDLKGYSFRKNNESPMWSNDEAGLPVFPGLVRYDEVSSGSINHSLRLAIPQMQNTWVWPARASAPLPGVYEPAHPPAGQRFRLKASYDISGFPPQAKVILQALKTYGAMAATNQGAAGWPMSIVGSPDTRWDYDDLDTLWRVNISDFEAVDVSSLMIDPNSAQARQLPMDTPTPPPYPTPAPTTTVPPSLTVTSPKSGEIWQRGTTQTIMWDYTGDPGSTVKIVLVKAGNEVGTITYYASTGSNGKGSYTWPMSLTGLTGNDFKVSVQSIGQPTIKDTNTNFFTITSSPLNVPPSLPP